MVVRSSTETNDDVEPELAAIPESPKAKCTHETVK